jgi:hypothetical protein
VAFNIAAWRIYASSVSTRKFFPVSFLARKAFPTERLTKICILGWSIAALAVELWLLRGAWPSLPITIAVACAAVAAASAFQPRVIAGVLVLTYVFPTLVYLHIGHYFPQYIDAWIALLLASILPRSVRTSWHFPGRWRGALVCWAMVTILGATIVTLREMDLTPALFNVTTLANTGGGGWPAFMTRWVLHVALVTTVGILWFDWLLSASDLDFHRVIATPLVCSVLLLGGVAVYQLFVDVTFLNPTVFANNKRASGTVFDANVCGTLAAAWIGGSFLLARHHPGWGRYLVPVGTAIGWLAVWATGSRTGFVAALIATIFNVVATLAASNRPRRAMVMTGGTAAVAILVLLLLGSAQLGVVGPVARFRSSVPAASPQAIKTVLYEQLWNRNEYGAASTAMIARHPWFGVGVGSFQSLLPAFVPRAPLPPDNAQNWYRHQLAELGVIGSLPWVAWLLSFGWYVLRYRRTDSPLTWPARGALIAIAAISFVGMPGQEPIVAITFWTFACWLVRLAGSDPPKPLTWRSGAVMTLVLAAYAAGTTQAAMRDLRVPVRAQRGGWPYSYGFYRAETGQTGSGPGWTRSHAVAVFQRPAEWWALTISADYRTLPGSAFSGASSHGPTRPSDIRIWCNGQLLIEEQITTTTPRIKYVRTPVDKWIFLESRVDRVVPLRQLGIDHDGGIGIMLDWQAADPGSIDAARVPSCGAEP